MLYVIRHLSSSPGHCWHPHLTTVHLLARLRTTPCAACGRTTRYLPTLALSNHWCVHSGVRVFTFIQDQGGKQPAGAHNRPATPARRHNHSGGPATGFSSNHVNVPTGSRCLDMSSGTTAVTFLNASQILRSTSQTQIAREKILSHRGILTIIDAYIIKTLMSVSQWRGKVCDGNLSTTFRNMHIS